MGQYLETLRAHGYRVLHDLISDGFNVDHALIGPDSIFTVETKTYHKPAKGKPEIVYDGARLMKHLDRAHHTRLDQHLQLGNLHESFLVF